MNTIGTESTIESKRYLLIEDITKAIKEKIIIGFRYYGKDFILAPHQIKDNKGNIEIHGFGMNKDDARIQIFNIKDIDDAEIFHVIRENSEFRIGKHIQDKVDLLLCFN